MKNIITYLSLLILGTLMSGLVSSILWGWFLVPVFHAPKLGIISAVGVCFTLRVMLGTNSSSGYKAESADQLFIHMVLYGLGYPLLILFVGWIIHLFV